MACLENYGFIKVLSLSVKPIILLKEAGPGTSNGELKWPAILFASPDLALVF